MQTKSTHKRTFRYWQNYGKPGCLYILANDAFAEGYYKIGCSTRSGHARADDLNKDASTGTPALFRCIFEFPTADCGRAEKDAFKLLAQFRTGKWGQEYFNVQLDHAKKVIEGVCRERGTSSPLPAPPLKAVWPAAPRIEPQWEPQLRVIEAPAQLVRIPAHKRNRWGGLFRLAAIAAVLWLGYSFWLGRQNQGTPAPAVHAASTQKVVKRDAKPAGEKKKKQEVPKAPARSQQPAVDTGHEAATEHLPPARTTLSMLTPDERESLDVVCSHRNDVSTSECMEAHLAQFDPAQRPVALSRLSPEDRRAADTACMPAKLNDGPAGYNICLQSVINYWSDRSLRIRSNQ